MMPGQSPTIKRGADHVSKHHIRPAVAVADASSIPASGVDGIKDVAIRGCKNRHGPGRQFCRTSARDVVDVTGKIVLPGLIDTHAHVYQYVTGRFGVNADMVGVQSGVTTLVDRAARPA